MLIEVTNNWIVSGSDESSHIECFSDIGSAAADHAFAAEFSGVPVERGQTGQGSDSPAVELSQFG